MARVPSLTSNIPTHVEKAAKTEKRERSKKQIRGAFKEKVFANLTPEEKDDLLKGLAVLAGLVEE